MKVPTLRKHASGQYMVRWGGVDHYLGHQKDTAEKLYEKELERWFDWRSEKKRTREQRNERERRGVSKVQQVIDQFLAAKRIENGHEAERYYHKHLKRFAELFGDVDSDMIRPKSLQLIKMEMLRGYAPKTINHDIGAIKTLWRWASGLDLVHPMDLAGVKTVPVGPVNDDSLTRAEICGLVRAASDRLRPWLVVNYLALLRPSEVVKVINRQGRWVGEGVFRLDKGKMDRRASIKRHCLFSPTALAWLDQCEPCWTRQDSYYHVMKSELDCGTKILQKSAASHLVREHDADPADVELLLGHVRGRLAVTYYQPAWPKLIGVASRLSLLNP